MFDESLSLWRRLRSTLALQPAPTEDSDLTQAIHSGAAVTRLGAALIVLLQRGAFVGQSGWSVSVDTDVALDENLTASMLGLLRERPTSGPSISCPTW